MVLAEEDSVWRPENGTCDNLRPTANDGIHFNISNKRIVADVEIRGRVE